MDKIHSSISSIFTDSTSSLSDVSDTQESEKESSPHGVSLVSSDKRSSEGISSAKQKFSKEKTAVAPLDHPSISIERNTLNDLKNKLALKIDVLKDLSKQAAKPDQLIYNQAIQYYGKAVIALKKAINAQEPKILTGLPKEHEARVQHRIFAQQLITKERAVAKYAEAAGDVSLKKSIEPNKDKQEMLQDIVNSYDTASYHGIFTVAKIKSNNFKGAALHDQMASLHAGLAELKGQLLSAKDQNDPSIEKLNKKINAYKKQIDLSENLETLRSNLKMFEEEVAKGSRGKNDLTIDALRDEIEGVQEELKALEKQ